MVQSPLCVSLSVWGWPRFGASSGGKSTYLRHGPKWRTPCGAGKCATSEGEAGLTGNFDAMLTNRMCVCGDFRKQLLFVAAAAVCDCVWHVARCTRYALLLLLLFATQCCTHTSDNNKNTGRQKKKENKLNKKRTRCTLDSRLTHVARCTHSGHT